MQSGYALSSKAASPVQDQRWSDGSAHSARSAGYASSAVALSTRPWRNSVKSDGCVLSAGGIKHLGRLIKTTAVGSRNEARRSHADTIPKTPWATKPISQMASVIVTLG